MPRGACACLADCSAAAMRIPGKDRVRAWTRTRFRAVPCWGALSEAVRLAISRHQHALRIHLLPGDVIAQILARLRHVIDRLHMAANDRGPGRKK